MKRIRLALHNLLGHPIMEICYIFGLIRLGNWIHDRLFKIDHPEETQIIDSGIDFVVIEKRLMIFAKLGTDEKILTYCQPNEARAVQQKLFEKDGCNWVLVEKLRDNEILSFKDDNVYQGFQGEGRYCNFITTL